MEDRYRGGPADSSSVVRRKSATLPGMAGRSGGAHPDAGVLRAAGILFELGIDEQPRPHRSVVEERHAAWLAKQRQAGVEFTADQHRWLDHIRDVVIIHAAIDHTELNESPSPNAAASTASCTPSATTAPPRS